MKRLLLLIGLFCSIGMHAEIHLPDSLWTFNKKGEHHHAEMNEIWLSADRPGVGAEVLGKGYIQCETGFEVTHMLDAHFLLLPNTLFRFGVHEKIEMRLEYAGQMLINDKPNSAIPWQNDPLYQPSYMYLGSKFQLCKLYGGELDKKWIPRIAFLVNAGIPVTSAIAKQTPFYGGAFLLFENEILEWLSISYDIGVNWSEWAPVPDILPSACINFMPTDRLGLFVEAFALFDCDAVNEKNQVYTHSDINFDLGVTYAVHPRVQLDLYGGFNLYQTNSHVSGPEHCSFVGLGLTWLIWHPYN